MVLDLHIACPSTPGNGAVWNARALVAITPVTPSRIRGTNRTLNRSKMNKKIMQKKTRYKSRPKKAAEASKPAVALSKLLC